jgi:ATP-dependent DNA helicase RecQ
MNHIIEVLTGAGTEKIRKWGHDQLSTYGIGKDVHRTHWAAIGRELVRLGYLHQSSEKFATVELTGEGINALKDRRPIPLTKPMEKPTSRRSARAGEIECDEILFERLRVFRKKLADERSVPAYIIFGDTTLRQMARHYPVSETDMGGISGIGEKKMAEFGDLFIAEIQNFLQSNPKIDFER